MLWPLLSMIPSGNQNVMKLQSSETIRLKIFMLPLIIQNLTVTVVEMTDDTNDGETNVYVKNFASRCSTTKGCCPIGF